MEKKNEVKKKCKKLFENPKTVSVIVVIGLIGIALIFFSAMFNTEKKEDETKSVTDTQAYGEMLENSLKEIIMKIDGVGRADILLTMENSSENVYLEQKDTKTKEIQPTVRGVVVVCDGAENPKVQERVLSAVTKALNISSAKVCITKLTSNGGT